MSMNTKAPIQRFRGNTSQNNSYLGQPGEIAIDTEKMCCVVHDGQVTGGVAQCATTGFTMTGAANMNGNNVNGINRLVFSNGAQMWVA